MDTKLIALEELRKSIEVMAAELNAPELTEKELDHVHYLWSDGDVSMTKSGSLLGLRNELCVARAIVSDELPIEYLPTFPNSRRNQRATFFYATPMQIDSVRIVLQSYFRQVIAYLQR